MFARSLRSCSAFVAKTDPYRRAYGGNVGVRGDSALELLGRAIKRVKGVRPHPSRRREAAAGGRKGEERADVRALSREELREIRGKRSVGVLVGGTRTGTVDDFAINIAIFEGRIKGSYL